MIATRSQNSSHRRNAFTLIELLIVIAIIGILIGFLVPAVSGALKRARVTSVRAEISQLETAIGKFRSVYNMDPPSQITLYGLASGWTGDANSRALIRQLWPQFNFAIDRDINGDGTAGDAPITLTSGECLVFFLGGISTTNIVGNIGSCTGFSKNPADPLARGGTREAPLFEFLPNRFTDAGTANGFPEYRDPLPTQTMPYLYFSAYDGTGYATAGEFGAPGLTEPYRQGTTATSGYWKPNSYQIISPGYDRAYGFGGAFVPTGTDRLPSGTTVSSQYPNAYTSTAPTGAQRAFEADNITNLASGELQP